MWIQITTWILELVLAVAEVMLSLDQCEGMTTMTTTTRESPEVAECDTADWA